ncbi:LysR family transcriptional regulator [Saccharopolyspora hordei]|uniref:DNA-binding transcriptional LysR family regulator n=1 Tax=Saccharopolyspora hordei TaxID=1838 RepID=A0A853AII4_9PSEU|nr:LysR family transcriptional regulator [Saccharopolyspora hordei]NYI84442.1 DNA-binding transcriptional LysR family regulator [Saccharopolyspora hordei]
MTRSFTLVQLRYFCAVAELENMTAAAAALNVTQSTLSSAVAQLEQVMGTQLFTRLPRRGLRLTSAGRRLHDNALRLLEEADQLPGVVREEGPTLVGDLTVGVFGPLAPFRAAVILEEFEREHPGVTLSFLEGDQEFLRRALRDGRCEVALMYDLGLGGELPRRVLRRIPPHVIVSPDHPLAATPDQPVSLRELAGEPFILLDLPHSREYYLSLFKLLGVAPRIRHRASGYETVRAFVARGHGYSVLNQRLPHDLTYAGSPVVPLPLAEELPPIEVLLVRPIGSRPTLKAQAFEDVCLRVYGVAPEFPID